MTQPTPVEKLSYRDAADELDEIVDGLDAGTVDIDTLSQQFQRAIDLIEELDRRISATKAQVEKIAPRLESLDSPESQS